MTKSPGLINDINMEELSIVLTGIGPVAIHFNLQAALIEAGCNVFWSPYQLTKEVFDHPIDIVFHLGMLSHGTAYINDLRKHLDKNNPKAVIIDLSASHPILSTVQLALKSVSDINKFLRDRKIVQWSVCSTTLREWEEYGLCNGIFAPLGLGRSLYCYRDSTKAKGDTAAWKQIQGFWINKTLQILKLPSNQIIGPTPQSDEPKLRNKVVYAGVSHSSWENFIPPKMIKKLNFLTENFLPNSKEVFQKITNMKIEQGNMEGFLNYHYSWSISVPLERRRKMVSLLSQHFKNHVSIWGDGWQEYVKEAYGTSMIPRYYYEKANCCLEFGSLGLDTPLYSRTSEIITRGGLLVSGVSSDDGMMIRENEFETSEQMLQIIEETFDPINRQEKLERQMLLFSNFGWDRILPELIVKAYKTV